MDTHSLAHLTDTHVENTVKNVIDSPIVQEAWNAGMELSVHGWVYHVGSARLRDLDVGYKGGTFLTLSPLESERGTDWEESLLLQLVREQIVFLDLQLMPIRNPRRIRPNLNRQRRSRANFIYSLNESNQYKTEGVDINEEENRIRLRVCVEVSKDERRITVSYPSFDLASMTVREITRRTVKIVIQIASNEIECEGEKEFLFAQL